ncbi:hypothetical protein BOTBODRAFT_183942 [Botryobasidium botryosum FD-172 SS1]|uniref:F-box domain-containing protein n=1 Tax=Botryobasidium botryosum (strain FD-172 SS1) TaxID=930990 RepID=A0A067MW06_BOTB1|nr:hypothetical protein BOTBODRAFT_183942 [Botryobasidium botryosum FD-172 SS1]
MSRLVFHPSPAQYCPLDVLAQVFSYVARPDVARASAVCSTWAHAARFALYTHIDFDATRPSTSSLASALRSSTLLRSYVRRIKLTYASQKAGMALYDWIPLIPADAIYSLEVAQAHRNDAFARLLLDAPGLRAVRHLTAHGAFASASSVRDCLALPCLETLSMNFPILSGPLELKTRPRLRRLSLSALSYSSQLSELLVAVGPTLEHFSLHLPFLPPPDAIKLANTLALHTPHLRHLSIQTFYKASIPFLDTLVCHLPALVSLHGGFGTYSNALLYNLPATVQVLQLQSHWTMGFSPFPVEAAVAAVTRARIGHSRLRRLEVLRHDHRSELREVEDACERAGVEFACLSEDRNERPV